MGGEKMWVNVLGVYLILGCISFGIGIIAKIRWGEKMKFRSLPFMVGMAIGILFWPLIMLGLPFILRMKRKSHKVEKLLGFCEHYNAFEPYCPECERAMKKEDEERTSGHSSYIATQASHDGTPVAFIGRMDPLDAERVRGDVERFIELNPTCPGCGKTGTITQYHQSYWVKCSACERRVFTIDPSVPESIDGPPPTSSFAPMLDPDRSEPQ